MLSATLHALFVGVMFYTAYALKDDIINKTQIMELVAGEGDNYAATDAPALGAPGGVKFQLPATPAPTPAPTPPAPAPEPVTPAQPEQAPVQAVAPPKVEPKPIAKAPPKPEPSPVVKAETKPPVKADPAIPNFEKNMKRVENRIAYKQKLQRDKEAKEEARQAALAAKNAEIAAKKAALLKEGGGQVKVAKIDAEGIAKGVIGGSTENKTGGAGGKALSREEQDLLATYVELLKQHLREAHEKPSGLSDNLVTKAEFYLAADGSVSKASIVKSSGSPEFDQSVLGAIHNVRTIGPPPDGKGTLLTMTFRMKDLE
jgi:colicin import membrane protein